MSSGSIYTNNTSTNQIITQNYLPDSGIPSSSTDYILPRQVGTGSTRGTQTIGVGNINIDGSNNQITITNNNTSSPSTIILGQQTLTSGQNGVATSSVSSSGAFGLSVTDSNNASINLGINASDNVELLFNDGTVNRLLVGKNAAGQEVVWISKPTIEVTTATPAGLAFSSTSSFTVLLQNSFTFQSLGSVPDGGFATSAVITIPHNAGFVPNVNCFAPLQVGSGFPDPLLPAGFPVQDVTLVTSGWVITQADSEFFNFFFSVDTENLYLGLGFANSSGMTVTALPITVYYTVFSLNATSS